MLIVVGVDVVASVLLSERQQNVPSQRIRVVSDGRDLLRAPKKHGSMNVTVRRLMMHVCSETRDDGQRSRIVLPGT